jgi:hypothetical protein
MPSLLLRIDARRRWLMTSFSAGPGCLADAEPLLDGLPVSLTDFGRLMRDIGVVVLCGVGIGVFVAMIGDLCT